MSYQNKYIKYKNKYLYLQKQIGGADRAGAGGGGGAGNHEIVIDKNISDIEQRYDDFYKTHKNPIIYLRKFFKYTNQNQSEKILEIFKDIPIPNIFIKYIELFEQFIEHGIEININNFYIIIDMKRQSIIFSNALVQLQILNSPNDNILFKIILDQLNNNSKSVEIITEILLFLRDIFPNILDDNYDKLLLWIINLGDNQDIPMLQYKHYIEDTGFNKCTLTPWLLEIILNAKNSHVNELGSGSGYTTIYCQAANGNIPIIPYESNKEAITLALKNYKLFKETVGFKRPFTKDDTIKFGDITLLNKSDGTEILINPGKITIINNVLHYLTPNGINNVFTKVKKSLSPDGIIFIRCLLPTSNQKFFNKYIENKRNGIKNPGFLRHRENLVTREIIMIPIPQESQENEEYNPKLKIKTLEYVEKGLNFIDISTLNEILEINKLVILDGYIENYIYDKYPISLLSDEWLDKYIKEYSKQEGTETTLFLCIKVVHK